MRTLIVLLCVKGLIEFGIKLYVFLSVKYYLTHNDLKTTLVGRSQSKSQHPRILCLSHREVNPGNILSMLLRLLVINLLKLAYSAYRRGKLLRYSLFSSKIK